jgi:phage gp36-like protein
MSEAVLAVVVLFCVGAAIYFLTKKRAKTSGPKPSTSKEQNRDY